MFPPFLSISCHFKRLPSEAIVSKIALKANKQRFLIRKVINLLLFLGFAKMHESKRPYLLGCFRVLSLVCHSFFVVKQMPSIYNELDNLTTGGVSAEVMKDPEAPPLPLGKTARGSREKCRTIWHLWDRAAVRVRRVPRGAIGPTGGFPGFTAVQKKPGTLKVNKRTGFFTP